MMRYFLAGAAAALILASSTPLFSKKPARGSSGGTSVAVSVAFGQGEVRAIHDYYRAYPPSLPPGLQKKLARGGSLPPGWQKKIAPLPVALERRLPPLECGYCGRGYLDGHVVLYNSRTMVALDVLRVF